MNPPRISVLLPARNAAPTLDVCLRSLRRQTETSWECIIVDDGSTDSTRDVAARAARRDARIHVISTGARGLIDALNQGLRHCRAPLIARMDADDLMQRDRLAAQADLLDRTGALAGVGCHVRLFPRRALSSRIREYEGWLNGMRSADDVRRDAFVECPLAHPTLMMRRELAALEYHDRGWPEDYDLILRALAAGMPIGIVPRRLLGWRVGTGTLSRTDPRYALHRFTACRAHYLAAGFLAGHGKYVLWGYGSTGRALRAALARLGKSPSHIVEIKTSRLGQIIHGAPVVPHSAVPALRGLPIVVSVARIGPRSEIRRVLSSTGFVEGEDYICAA